MKTYHVRVHQGDLEIDVTSEDKEFVESQLKKFFPAMLNEPVERPRGQTRTPDGRASVAGKPLSLAEFKKLASPSSGPEYVACLAYYLEKHQNISEFGTKEILAGLKDMRLNVKNPSDTIVKAKGAGYLMPGKNAGMLMLSSSGEKLVEELIERAKKQPN
jgi:hypothetical protein